MLRAALIARALIGLVVIVIAAAYFLGGGSKINDADLAKLNTAATNLRGTSTLVKKGMYRCAGEIDLVGCMNKLGKKVSGVLVAAAATYDQVAADASGKCKTALSGGAADLRATAKQFTSPHGNPDPAKMLADQKTIADACKLKLEPIKG